MLLGLNEMAELTQKGVILRYDAGSLMLMMNVYELPADIFVLPATLIE